MINRRPVSSVGRVPDYRAGGRGFKPRPDHHLGSLNNRGESAAFVMTFVVQFAYFCIRRESAAFVMTSANG